MRNAFAVLALLFTAFSGFAADPVYLDQLMETPLATLQTQFPGLKKEGCYRLADGRYVRIEIDRKDGKPKSVTIANVAPCRKATDGPAIDVRQRKGVELGDTTIAVIEKMGRPDASAAPEAPLAKLGETEYFYVCRVSEGCARHTSIVMQNGLVTAIAEWYSE